MQGAALLNQVGHFSALPLSCGPSVKQVALSRWVTEALLVMLAVNINERADLAGKAANRHQFIVDAGHGTAFSVHLTNGDLIPPLRGDLQVDAEAVSSGAYRTGISATTTSERKCINKE
jgi:hypothetical protein